MINYCKHNVDKEECEVCTPPPEQGDIFAPRARARLTDPDTSHEAAKAVNVTARQMEVLVALARFPAGATAEELCDSASLPWNTATPRLRPLARNGCIAEAGRKRASTGRNQIIWKVTAKGRAALP